jgi:hypothetical protein
VSGNHRKQQVRQHAGIYERLLNKYPAVTLCYIRRRPAILGKILLKDSEKQLTHERLEAIYACMHALAPCDWRTARETDILTFVQVRQRDTGFFKIL